VHLPAAADCVSLYSAAAGSGVKVAHAQGMDLMGQIHYDWPLETALEVRLLLLLTCCCCSSTCSMHASLYLHVQTCCQDTSWPDAVC
jgi:hypothetical protein